MSTPQGFPSFFVVGAQKAGTTSLHSWLSQQPDVCLPKFKETQFFSNHEIYARGIDWYLRQFPKGKAGAIVGEVCPDYMFSKEAARRIYDWTPAPKLVFIFRHPIARAFSHYLMTRRMGYETLPFDQALLRESERLASGEWRAYMTYSYMARGQYTVQVEHFRQVFPQASFLYMRFDDLTDPGEKGQGTYRRVCEFIGVRSSPLIADRDQADNVASEPRNRWLSDFLYKPHRLKRFLGRCIPGQTIKQRIAVKLSQWNRKPVKYLPDVVVPIQIFQQAQKEIESLQGLTQLDLSDWLERTYSLGGE